MSALKTRRSGLPPAVDYSVGEIVKAFAHNLSECRSKHAWSIRLAAKKLGVAESTWSQWESGKRFPSPECLKIIGILFDVCPGMLIVDCGRCQRDCAHKPPASCD
jgi:DNA-binding XRE family transcriptional regulator